MQPTRLSLPRQRISCNTLKKLICATLAVCFVLANLMRFSRSSHSSPTNWHGRGRGRRHEWRQAYSITVSEALKIQNSNSNFAICSIQKNERSIREWAYHHTKHFNATVFLYDHESVPPMNSTLSDYIKMNLVQYGYFECQNGDGMNCQKEAYKLCYEKAKKRHKFIAFFDGDEYLWFRNAELRSKGISAYLQEWYDKGFAGFGVNWILYGATGMKKRIASSIRDSFVGCSMGSKEDPALFHIKTIVFAERVEPYYVSPHNFKPLVSCIVDSRGDCITSHLANSFIVQNISLHHYVTRSKEDYIHKMEIGSAAGNQ